MPNPVEVLSGPLVITPKDNERAEQLLSAILQVIGGGTAGADPATYPTLVPDTNITTLAPLRLTTAESQQLHRQLSIALAKVVPTWITSDPDPDPVISNPETFEASCGSSVRIGDIVSVVGSNSVAKVEPLFSKGGIPIVAAGIVVEKPSNTACIVRTRGYASVYSGLDPGKIYVVGQSGVPSRVMPVPTSSYNALVQTVGKALNSSTLDVSVSNNPIIRTL